MSTPPIPIHEKEQSEPDWMNWATDRRSIGSSQADYKIPHPYGRNAVCPPADFKHTLLYPPRDPNFIVAGRPHPRGSQSSEKLKQVIQSSEKDKQEDLYFAPGYYKIEFAESFPTPTEEGIAKGWYDMTPWEQGFCNHSKDIPKAFEAANRGSSSSGPSGD